MFVANGFKEFKSLGTATFNHIDIIQCITIAIVPQKDMTSLYDISDYFLGQVYV